MADGETLLRVLHRVEVAGSTEGAVQHKLVVVYVGAWTLWTVPAVRQARWRPSPRGRVPGGGTAEGACTSRRWTAARIPSACLRRRGADSRASAPGLARPDR